MLSRLACQRRVYRLATLLTGDPGASTKVVKAVVDAQPDPRMLDSAHLDRLTVLRSREIPPAVIADGRLPLRVAQAVRDLPAQQREAWVLCRVYQASRREAARAMDCSSTATTIHLEQAEAMLKETLGDDAATAAGALRAYSLAIDVPAYYLAARGRVRQIRQAALAALVLAAVALALVVLQLLAGG
jgi:hypothetical protein